MSKVVKIVGLAVGVAAVVALISASLVFADPPPPPDDDFHPCAGAEAGYYGCGMPRGYYGPQMGRGYYGPGMGGGWMAEYQTDYRDEMHAAIAEALGLSVEEFDSALAEGQTMREIAEAQGIDPEDVWEAMREPREAIIAQAVEDGVITQEEADWMLERIGGRDWSDWGGSPPCHGRGFRSRVDIDR